MRFGIPLLADRVAPRSTIAEAIMLVTLNRSKVTSSEIVPLEGNTWIDILRALIELKVDTMVCGGIDNKSKEALRTQEVSVIDNVACTIDEVIEALEKGKLGPGYGFNRQSDKETNRNDIINYNNSEISQEVPGTDKRSTCDIAISSNHDCLSCAERICFKEESCSSAAASRLTDIGFLTRHILDAATDISSETERTLCRLSELVYFCLEMKYKQIGIAFCMDLLEPTEILAGVLRRFFDVTAVGCKIGGVPIKETYTGEENRKSTRSYEHIACNPLGQAEILNCLGTDLNVIVGLCMGIDCIFTRESQAPVTTLFVKDKSLANNPIGALYSDYYLKEAAGASVGRL